MKSIAWIEKKIEEQIFILSLDNVEKVVQFEEYTLVYIIRGMKKKVKNLHFFQIKQDTKPKPDLKLLLR